MSDGGAAAAAYALELRKANERIAELEAENAAIKAERDGLRAIGEEIMGIVKESTGVVGWHLNGDILRWEQFEAIQALEEALAGQRQEGRE